MISRLKSRMVKGFTLIELMIVVAIIGVLAAVAIPAFMKYIRKSKTTEAVEGIKKIYDGARSYYLEESNARASITPIPKQFPRGAGMTPAAGNCCGGTAGDKCAPEPTQWKTPEWSALKFSMDDPHYYAYQYDWNSATGNASKFTARAQGDLDCDGTPSTFEMVGAVDSVGNVQGSAGIFKNQELE